MTPLELFGIAWTVGGVATYFALIRKISTDSPLVGFGLAMAFWPVFWILK